MTKFWNFRRPKANTNQNKQVSTECLSKDAARKSGMEQVKFLSDQQSKSMTAEGDGTGDKFKADFTKCSAAAVASASRDHTIYYAVSLPFEARGGGDDEEIRPLYFTDKQEAFQEIKKHKGARFKTFRTEEEAVAFALQPAEQTCPTPKGNSPFHLPSIEVEKATVVNEEKPSPFKGPKSQDMVKLRKAIEAGNDQYFNETVWSNPRYLISSGDTPAILQEGFRYNALHVAAKHKQAEMCELVLKTIEDPKFMELLYSDDADDIRMQRITYITDLYLNMPDKGLCETPLHFACKFGCLQAVRVLACHPLCDKKRKNKYGLEPKEIICERCPSSSSDVKQRIEEAFEGQYFVPVLRAEDNSLQPIIGRPYTQDKESSVLEEIQDSSPCKAKLSIMAVAGPLSPENAELFYKFWKTPTSQFSRTRYQYLNKIRLSDTEKGLEILGRHLARSFNAPWSEYWPSLNAWCDISSKEGLQLLENRLKTLYYMMSSKDHNLEEEESPVLDNIKDETNDGSPCLRESSLHFTHSTPTIVTADSSSNSSTSSGGMSSLCSGFMNLHLSESERACTSPDMPSIFRRSGSTVSSTNSGNVLSDSSSTMQKICQESKNNLLTTESDLKNFNTPRRIFTYPRKPSFQETSDLVQNGDGDGSISAEQMSSKKWSVRDFRIQDQTTKHDLCSQKSYECVLENNFPHSFIVPIRAIVETMFNVFSNIMANSLDTVNTGMHMHLLLAEDVIPKIGSLLQLSSSVEKDLSSLHSIVSFAVSKEMHFLLTHHELDLLFRCIENYLDTHSSYNLSDHGDSLEQSYTRSCASHDNKLQWEHLWCILKYLLKCKSIAVDSNLTQNSCECSWLNDQHKDQNVQLKLEFQDSLESSDSKSAGSADDECDSGSFLTPPCSPSGIVLSSDEEDHPVTPDEGLEVYVEGKWPSKADMDMLRAIEHLHIDPVTYPHVCRWKHLISLKDENTVQSWPSPSASRFRGRSLCTIRETPATPSPIKVRMSLSASETLSRKCPRNNTSDYNLREANKLFDRFVRCED